jgi:ABC-2 type transport system ATP-binding protein
MVGLLGPNGAGKTTLLKMIATLLYPASGRILVQGIDVVADPYRARHHMGLVTCDERSFYWRLSGRQNLMFFATLDGIPKKRAAHRVADLLEMLGLTAAADRSFFSYSSGMRQKMSIGRGLLSNPDIVLYDEPTRSLDPLSTAKIHEWLIENRRRHPATAHLIATNQLREAELLCDRVFIISGGGVIADGTIADIRSRFLAEQPVAHRISFRGASLHPVLTLPSGDGLLRVTSVDDEADDRTVRVLSEKGSGGLSLVLDCILRSGGRVVECTAEHVEFEEIFCSLVQSGTPVAAGGGE